MLESADGEEDQDAGADWTDLCLSDSTPQLCTSEMLHPYAGPSSWGRPKGRHSLAFRSLHDTLPRRGQGAGRMRFRVNKAQGLPTPSFPVTALLSGPPFPPASPPAVTAAKRSWL